MIIVMLGAPGSGKGTQSQMLSVACSVPLVSMSGLLKEEIKANSMDGIYIKDIMDRGELVPDDITINLLNKKLHTLFINEVKCILDGYPRTYVQAESLSNIMLQNRYGVTVIDLVVPEDVLIQRFTGRFICANCGASYHSELHRPNIEGQCDYCDNKNFIVRKDDNIDAIKTRLDIYHHNTKPLIEYYKGKSVLVEVDGNRDISVIFEEIKNILKG